MNMAKLTKKDIGEIHELRNKFPSTVRVKAARSEDGGFIAEIVTFPGCFTQGNTFSELVEMINDCIKCYLDIPEKYFAYMPTYLAPLSMAQYFDAFPVSKKEKELRMPLSNRERIKS